MLYDILWKICIYFLELWALIKLHRYSLTLTTNKCRGNEYCPFKDISKDVVACWFRKKAFQKPNSKDLVVKCATSRQQYILSYSFIELSNDFAIISLLLILTFLTGHRSWFQHVAVISPRWNIICIVLRAISIKIWCTKIHKQAISALTWIRLLNLNLLISFTLIHSLWSTFQSKLFQASQYVWCAGMVCSDLHVYTLFKFLFIILNF